MGHSAPFAARTCPELGLMSVSSPEKRSPQCSESAPESILGLPDELNAVPSNGPGPESAAEHAEDAPKAKFSAASRVGNFLNVE